MELANRPQLEADWTDRLSGLSERHRQQLDRLLGNPPDAANVPASFWDQVQRETEEEILALLFFIFIAAATQHGWTDGDQRQQAATGFALSRGAAVARSYAETSFSRTANNFPGGEPGPIDRTARDERLEKVFSRGRAAEVVVDNTTAGTSAGGEAATANTVGLSNKDTWYTAEDNRVCTVCGPLHGKLRDDWSRFFPSGPPAHPACRCWVIYENEKTSEKVGESMSAAALRTFDPAQARDDATALVVQAAFQGAAATVAGLMEGMEERMTARAFSSMREILVEVLERSQAAQEAAMKATTAALIESNREMWRTAMGTFTEQLIEERQRPNIIEVTVQPTVINVPEQVQEAPQVTVNVNPEVRAVLEQQPRTITLQRSGDKLTGKSE